MDKHFALGVERYIGIRGGGCVDKSVFFYYRHKETVRCRIYLDNLDLSRELLPRTRNNGFLASFIYSN